MDMPSSISTLPFDNWDASQTGPNTVLLNKRAYFEFNKYKLSHYVFSGMNNNQYTPPKRKIYPYYKTIKNSFSFVC